MSDNSEAGQNPAHCDIPYETSAFGFPNYYYYIRTYVFVNRKDVGEAIVGYVESARLNDWGLVHANDTREWNICV